MPVTSAEAGVSAWSAGGEGFLPASRHSNCLTTARPDGDHVATQDRFCLIALGRLAVPGRGTLDPPGRLLRQEAGYRGTRS